MTGVSCLRGALTRPSTRYASIISLVQPRVVLGGQLWCRGRAAARHVRYLTVSRGPQEGYSSEEEAEGMLQVGGVAIRCRSKGHVRQVRWRGSCGSRAEAPKVASSLHTYRHARRSGMPKTCCSSLSESSMGPCLALLRGSPSVGESAARWAPGQEASPLHFLQHNRCHCWVAVRVVLDWKHRLSFCVCVSLWRSAQAE